MDGSSTMRKIALEARAGEVSAELARRGIAADARVHVLVDIAEEDADLPSMAAVAEAGGAFGWLAEEFVLYTHGMYRTQYMAPGGSEKFPFIWASKAAACFRIVSIPTSASSPRLNC